jgi:hypothetical protein
MMDKQNEQVDFSNVTFGDFGRLSPAQKVGFLITLPIALPVVAVVKFFELFTANDGHQEVVQESTDHFVMPSTLDTRVLDDADWHADEMAYGEMIADMNVYSSNN